MKLLVIFILASFFASVQCSTNSEASVIVDSDESPNSIPSAVPEESSELHLAESEAPESSVPSAVPEEPSITETKISDVSISSPLSEIKEYTRSSIYKVGFEVDRRKRWIRFTIPPCIHSVVLLVPLGLLHVLNTDGKPNMLTLPSVYSDEPTDPQVKVLYLPEKKKPMTAVIKNQAKLFLQQALAFASISYLARSGTKSGMRGCLVALFSIGLHNIYFGLQSQQ